MAETTRTCRKCGRTKPADTYHFKEKGRWLTGSCRECLNAHQRAWWNERRRREIEAAGPVTIPATRECSACHESKPLTREFFDARRDGMYGLATLCIECRKAKAREKWRSDPAWRARRLAGMRIDRRLKAMREGREVAVRHDRRTVDGYRRDVGAAATLLDAAPLAAWLDVVIAREIPDYGLKVGDGSRNGRSRTVDDLAGELGVPPRRVWAINSREQRRVAFATADKLITNYGDVVGGDAMAAMLAERCRAMPGNGERLLRYMDAAEAIAHLAGTAVYRVADLYPEMA